MDILLCVLLFLLDQASKIWAAAYDVDMDVIGKLFRFRYKENPGMAFSFLGDKSWGMYFLSVVTFIAILVIIPLYLRAKHKTLKYGLMLLLSGALGNLVDRVCTILQRHNVGGLTGFHEGVRDFLDVTFFANCNVADVAVTAGVILVMVYLLFVSEDAIFKKQPKKEALAAEGETPAGSGQAAPGSGEDFGAVGEGAEAYTAKAEPAENNTGAEKIDSGASESGDTKAESGDTKAEIGDTKAAESGASAPAKGSGEER